MRGPRPDQRVRWRRHSAARWRPAARPDWRSRPVVRRQHLAVANPGPTHRQTWPRRLRRQLPRRRPCDPHRPHPRSAARQVRPAERRLRPAPRDRFAVRRARAAERRRRVCLAPQSGRLAHRLHSVERRQHPAVLWLRPDLRVRPAEQWQPPGQRLDRQRSLADHQALRVHPDQRGRFAVRRGRPALRRRCSAGAKPRRTEPLQAGSPPAMSRWSLDPKQMHPSPAVRRGRSAAEHRRGGRRCQVVHRDPAGWQRFARWDRPAARGRIVQRTRHRSARGSRSARCRNPAARRRSVRRIERSHRRRAPTGQRFRRQWRFVRCRPRQERPIEWQRFRSRRSWTLPQWSCLAEWRWRGCLRLWRGSECPAERWERQTGRHRFRVCPAGRMACRGGRSRLLGRQPLRDSCQPSRRAGFPWLPRRLR